MIIEVSLDGKRRIIEFPKFFEERGFKRCFTKEQFDHLSWNNYEHKYMYFDYKKKIIYFHEFVWAPIRDDGDYVWDSTYDYKKRVLDIWAN